MYPNIALITARHSLSATCTWVVALDLVTGYIGVLFSLNVIKFIPGVPVRYSILFCLR